MLLQYRHLPVPQLDLVRMFACYATPGEAGETVRQDPEKNSTVSLLRLVHFRGVLWDLLKDSLPEERHDELWAELSRKHCNHIRIWAKAVDQQSNASHGETSPWIIASRWQRWLFPRTLCFAHTWASSLNGC